MNSLSAYLLITKNFTAVASFDPLRVKKEKKQQQQPCSSEAQFANSVPAMKYYTLQVHRGWRWSNLFSSSTIPAASFGRHLITTSSISEKRS
jgi:hypothetical protein